MVVIKLDPVTQQRKGTRTMERRKFIRIGASGAAIIALSSSNALAFTHNKLLGGGGGGGASWGAIAKEFKAGMTIMAKQSQVMLLAIADLADALHLKQEAAQLRLTAKDIKEGGMGKSNMDAGKEQSDEVLGLAKEKIESGDKLTAAQQVKVTKAAAKYAPALAKGMLGGIKLVSAGKKASSAGTPGMSDGMEIINLAKDIPTLVPAAVSFMGNAVEGGNAFFDVLRENDYDTPEEMEMKM